LRDTPKLDSLRGFDFDRVFGQIRTNREAKSAACTGYGGPTSIGGAASSAGGDPELKKAANALSRQVMSVGRAQLGSAAQRASLRGDAIGLAANLNLFEIFFTASPSDTTTMRVQMVHRAQEVDITALGFGIPRSYPDYADRSNHVTQDPFAAARWFQREIENFFRAFIRVDLSVSTVSGDVSSTGLTGEQGIFGIVTGHAGSAEASGKGSNHGHWCIASYGCGPNRLEEQLRDKGLRPCLLAYKESVVSQRAPLLSTVDAAGDRPVASTPEYRRACLAACMGSGAELCRLAAQSAAGEVGVACPGAVRSAAVASARGSGGVGMEDHGVDNSEAPEACAVGSGAASSDDLYLYGPGCSATPVFAGTSSTCDDDAAALEYLSKIRFGVSMIPSPDPDKCWATPRGVPAVAVGSVVWFKEDHERRDMRLGVVDALEDGSAFFAVRPGVPPGSSCGTRVSRVACDLVRPAPVVGSAVWKDCFERNERSHGILLQALLVVPGCLSGAVWHEVMCVRAETGVGGLSSADCDDAGSLVVAFVEYVQLERLRVRELSGALKEFTCDSWGPGARRVLLPGRGVDGGWVRGIVLEEVCATGRVLEESRARVPGDIYAPPFPAAGRDEATGFRFVAVRHEATFSVPLLRLRKFNLRLFSFELAMREQLAVESVEVHDCTPGCFKKCAWLALAKQLCRMGYPQPLVSALLQQLLARGEAPAPGRGKGRGEASTFVEVCVLNLQEAHDSGLLNKCLSSVASFDGSRTTVIAGSKGLRMAFVSFCDQAGALEGIEVLRREGLQADLSKQQVQKNRLAVAPTPVPAAVFMNQSDARLVVPSNRVSLACTGTNQCAKLMCSGEDSKAKVKEGTFVFTVTVFRVLLLNAPLDPSYPHLTVFLV